MATKVLLKTKEFEEILARKNLSQVSLARMIDTSENYLSMLKNGTSPSPQFREKMLRALNVSFDDIFFLEICCSDDKTGQDKESLSTTV